ncbi:MAG: 1-acyl-sn-glycerol-3-phosphate acyltransferase [Bacteroidales bacterium]|nr:1-acyl-sn-glycerol-3-phosphate acyltransferase [Bacteroidales bacterium]
MLDYSKINKFDLTYSIAYQYLKVAHNHLYYRSYHVLNSENIPKDGGFLVICNHQNGLNDALGILFALTDHTSVFIARADIFKKEFVAKLLRFLRIMPAFRKQDTGVENLGNNDIIFKESARVISEGDVVALFPEAGHKDKHTLGTFKKGFARIAFKAAELNNFEKPITILPLGNHYDNYFHFRNRLVINVGTPFEFSDLYDLYKENPERARYLLAKRAREHVEPLMLNMAEDEHYPEYEMINTIYRDQYCRKHGLRRLHFPNHLKADQTIYAKIAELRENDPEHFNSLTSKVAEYRQNLKQLRLRDWIFTQRGTTTGMFVAALFWIATLPLGIYSHIVNIIPYKAGNLLTRKVKDRMLHSSFYFAIGALVTFPFFHLTLAAVAWAVFHTFKAAVLFILTAPLSLLFYYNYKVLTVKLYNRIRKSFLKHTGDKTIKRTAELRKEIFDDLDKLEF